MGSAEEDTIPFIGLSIEGFRIAVKGFGHEQGYVFFRLVAIATDQTDVGTLAAGAFAQIEIPFVVAAEWFAFLAVVAKLRRRQSVGERWDYLVVVFGAAERAEIRATFGNISAVSAIAPAAPFTASEGPISSDFGWHGGAFS